jgi:Fe2+ transport system protein B
MILFCKLDGGGVASGGLRDLIPCIARTAVAVGVDGIFMEVAEAVMLLCFFYLAFLLRSTTGI